MTKVFEVTLEIRKHGSACGTTFDLIEAGDAGEAIRKARSEWKRVAPGYTFAPLLVIERRRR